MKILLDTCVWGGAVKDLQAADHDVIWAGLIRAHMEGRVLVTLDKDFGELAIVRRIPHSGILRLVNFPARRQGFICRQILARHKQELSEGAIITADSHRIRIRPAFTQKS